MPRDTHPEVWTPDLVRKALVEAVSWSRQFGGPVGPAGVRSTMPHYRATLEDHLDEGWGLPEVAGDEPSVDGRPVVLPPPPERVSQLLEALGWVGRYLLPDHPGSAQMLQLWLRCKTRGDGRGFDPALRRMGMGRGHAYRLRDRALSRIAQGLTVDGSRPW